MDWKGDPVLPMETIDIFIHGDGEQTMDAVLNALANGEVARSILQMN